MAAPTADPRWSTLPGRLQSAADHATANVPVAHPDEPVGTLLERMTGRSFDSVADVAVCLDGRLVGMVSIEQVVGADADTTMAELMDRDPATVAPGVDQEAAAWRMVAHGQDSLAVVDAQHRLMGLIPPERMLAVLMEEHDEDLSRLAGVLAPAARARSSTEERVTRRLLHRLPWLAIGLVGAMASAWIVRSQEAQLQRTVQLAFFLPAIVYMADAVGTQTETLAIRGLSLGIPIRRILAKEAVTGVAIGTLIAALFLPFSLWIFDDSAVAATVALALLASCTVASIVALVLPWVLALLGRDPAFGSGPVATVIQDLLSLLIYLGVAAALVR